MKKETKYDGEEEREEEEREEKEEEEGEKEEDKQELAPVTLCREAWVESWALGKYKINKLRCAITYL